MELSAASLLPQVFAAVMGLSLLMYVVLDGYDLGVGLLLPFAQETEKNQMIASIGPFWDANETWIVLGVGVLLIAFPQAHGIILTSLTKDVAQARFKCGQAGRRSANRDENPVQVDDWVAVRWIWILTQQSII